MCREGTFKWKDLLHVLSLKMGGRSTEYVGAELMNVKIATSVLV